MSDDPFRDPPGSSESITPTNQRSDSPPRLPPTARVSVPYRDHEDPSSMGEDAHLRDSTSAGPLERPGSLAGDSIRSAASASSGAGLRETATAPALGGAAISRRSSRLGDTATTSVATPQTHQPGMPIGLLAALGTPFAKKPLYRSRKCKILCPIVTLLTMIITVLITIYPVLNAIAKHTLSVAVLDVTSSNITSPTNSSFALTLEGQVRKVGIFPAHLHFTNPIVVHWIAPENLTNEIELGQFLLAPIGVAAGHGRIKQQTVFNITNEPGFARFTEYLITQEAFTWRLRSEHVKAVAFGFISTANNLAFSKDLTLPGINSFTDVSISDFQLPGDDPAGGITLAVTTKLTNPSAFGVELGELAVGLYYDGLYLGPARTSRPMNLTAGVNYINLVGRLVDYSANTTALDQLSTLFSNYLNGRVTPVTAVGLSATLASGQTVDWLTKGIQALVLSVPLASPQAIKPITGIAIEALSLDFTPATSWAPMANSSALSATFGLPFGFSLDIVSLENAFDIVDNRSRVVGLRSPMGQAHTTLLSKNSGFMKGSIALDLPLAPLKIGSTEVEQLIFSQFTTDLTTTNGSTFFLSGNTTAITNTPIGQVKLTDIGFVVPAGLLGLEGLTQHPTTILSVDVLGGTPDALVLSINVGLTNPSNLDLTVGNVTFQLYNGKNFLGTTILPNLHLISGYQEIAAVGYFQANANPVALQTLTDFASGTHNVLGISGFNGSTAIESLTQAFMALHLNATLEGLKTGLLNYANVTILPSTGVANNFANSVVSLQNPFTAALRITNIQANVTTHGFSLGSINVDTDFVSQGLVGTVSPVLDFNLNLFPPDIFAVLRALVVQTGTLDPAPLDGIVALGGYTYSTPKNASAPLQKRDYRSADEDFMELLVAPAKTGRVDVEYSSERMSVMSHGKVSRHLSKRGLYTGFNLPSYVLAAFKALKVEVDLVAVLHVGDFQTDLAYRQAELPAYTDASLTLLLPVLARPIVQKIVDAAALGISTVMINNPANDNFHAGLVGSITNAGPFDATIAFPQGLTVAWNGAPLGQIAMPDVTLVADVGASLNLNATFNVANVAHLSDFTGYLLSEPSFTWQIYSQDLKVTALGIAIDGISISKDVVLDGFNGLRGLVKIDAFDLPANDPAGGITLTLATTITNPSSVGIALSSLGFRNTFGETMIGPAGSATPVVLTPKATITLPLAGRLVPQTTPQGLADVSTIFNGYIHGIPSNLIVHGDSAGNPECTWLTNGIKQLSIAVVLPAAHLDVINSISLNQLTLMFSPDHAYAPLFSTDNTVATFQLPFAFPVDITQIATSITAGSGGGSSRKRATGGDFAQLDVPMVPSKTDVVSRHIQLTFRDVPFQSTADDLFSSFLVQTTDGTSMDLGLHGSASTIATTAVGELHLEDISFAVTSSILGLQGLNARPATVSELDVARGFSSYLQINVNAHLYNPSNITIGTGDVAFGLSFQGTTIGTAVIPGLVLVPGDNVIATQVHYQPEGSALASGQQLLENFVQGVVSDTLIVGNTDTTPIKSLQAALASIQLATSIPPIHQNLITQANLAFPTDIGQTGVADAQFVLGNPFTASINLLGVVTNATYRGIVLGNINQQSLNPPIHAPGHTSITSPTLPLALNTDPKVLIQFIEAAALDQGVDLGILLPEFAYVLGLTSTASAITTSVNPDPETCTPTRTTKSVDALILGAVKNLRTNLTIVSDVTLDDYRTPLNFVQNQVPTVLADSVLFLTGLIGKSIVGNIVSGAVLSFSSGVVSQLTDAGFTVALKGSLLNVGPFDALIEFPQGVAVGWQGSHIADIALPPICNAGGAGVPALETTGVLTITDNSRFTDFATFILLNPSFEWTISTNKLRVLALGTIFDNITLSKNVSFSAFNGLLGTTIVNPDFPSDAPNGIALVTDTLIPSPSNLGIELGHASFIASFEGQEVGPIDAFGLTLAPLATTSAHLTGTIIKRTSSASTASLGVLFSQFLAGVNQTLAVTGNEVISPAQPNSPVNWLSAAFKKLTLNVILPGHVYQVISAVKLEDLTVTINKPSEAYSVPTQSNDTHATFRNPFGFSLTPKQVGGSFIIERDGVDAGVLTLPIANVLSAETSTGQDASLVIDFKQPQILQSLNDDAFRSLFNSITNTVDVPFVLHGVANVTAGTNAGDIPITGIPFNVSTDLLGLQSLNARPTVVGNLDVHHGYPTYLQINADASLYNPSNVTIITDQVIFGLEFASEIIGSVVIGDLLLIPGANVLGTAVHYAPSGGASTVVGELLLANYVQGIVSNVSIVGTPQSSPYGSLREALGTISIHTTIPPLEQALITQAALTFPLDIAQTGIAMATFDLSNPFTASVNLVSILTNATYESFFLGQIDSQNLSPEISASGHANITSRALPFKLTDDPKFLIQFIEAAAHAQGVDLGILLPVFAFVLAEPTTVSLVNATVNPNKETCAPTGTTVTVDNLILAAVANLRSDLGIASTLRLDDYQTNLNFVQQSVPTLLDRSVLYLTGFIGKTIVSNIVTQATLSFSGGTVTNITDSGFTVVLKGSLLNAGPFDALISFPYGLEVIWQGSNIASLSLPPICSPGGSAVPDLETTAVLTITDEARFTTFAAFILSQPSFDWTVTTDRLRVEALGTIFDNVSLSKNVTFQAFNKLAPGVTVINPDFPGDASNGIKLSLDSLVPSPSNLGIDLGDVTFVAAFAGQPIGPVSGSNLILPPKSVTPLHLTGTILHTDSQANLDALGALFSQFLAGKNSTLQVTGDSVTSPAQPHSPVTWLSAAFRTLTLDVVLPGHVYNVISSIKLLDLTVFVQDPTESFAPRVTNNATNVEFKNPFGFSLQAVQAGGDFIIEYNGVDAGLLTVPVENSVSSQTSTGQVAELVIHIVTPAVLTSLNNAAFETFFADVTNKNGVEFTLHGGANVTARTAAGDIPIGGIQFSVPSTFPGVNAFNHVAMIPATPIVIGGGSGNQFDPAPGGEFLRITFNVILGNPAPLVLHTNLVSFEVIFQNYLVGHAYIDPLDLFPGSNTFKAEFHYQPADPNSQVAQQLLTQYLSTTGPVALTVQGDQSSSPYGSLQQALSQITLPTSFPGQGLPLIHDIVIHFDLFIALCNGTVNIETRLNNHLATDITVQSIKSTATQDGVEYAAFSFTFDQAFTATPDVVPSPYSQTINPVFLSQGALGSLPLLFTGAKGLDVNLQAAASIGGYVAPSLQYSQKAVPYSIIISIGDFIVDAAGIKSIFQNPLYPIVALFADLKNIVDCAKPGHLGTLIGGAESLLPRIPSLLLPLIGGAEQGIASFESRLEYGLCSFNPLICRLLGISGGNPNVPVSVLPTTGYTCLGGASECAAHGLSGGVPDPTSSAVVLTPVATSAASTSAAPLAPAAPTPIVAATPLPAPSVAAKPTTAGSSSPAAPVASTGLHRREDLPVHDFDGINSFLAFDSFEDVADAASPTAQAAPATPTSAPLSAAQIGGVSPVVLEALLKKHGFRIVEPVADYFQRRNMEEDARVLRSKRK